MRPFRLILVLCGLSVAVVVNCDSVTGPSIEDSGSFKISVSSGTKPTYSWSAGPAMTLGVARYPSLEDVWSVVKTDAPYISSPVTHGTIPPGASESFLSGGQTTLSKGTKYLITVTLSDGRAGFKVFTP